MRLIRASTTSPSGVSDPMARSTSSAPNSSSSLAIVAGHVRLHGVQRASRRREASVGGYRSQSVEVFEVHTRTLARTMVYRLNRWKVSVVTAGAIAKSALSCCMSIQTASPQAFRHNAPPQGVPPPRRASAGSEAPLRLVSGPSVPHAQRPQRGAGPPPGPASSRPGRRASQASPALR